YCDVLYSLHFTQPPTSTLFPTRRSSDLSQWIKTLIGGPTDVDRLQYVAGDMASADGLAYDVAGVARGLVLDAGADSTIIDMSSRSEEHTSELQSLAYLVCRLLLEKKNYN